MYIILRSLLVLLILLNINTQVSAAAFSKTYSLSDKHKTGDIVDGIRLQGALKLGNQEINGLRAIELSGLAWDADDNILYAISDDGHLVHLAVSFEGDFLVGAEYIAAFPLMDQQQQQLPEDGRDAEGLEIINGNNGIKGDSELLICFEVQPRIGVYSPQGKHIREITLNESLKSISNYYGRNSALESVVIHPSHGILTIPQRPLRTTQENQFAIHSMTGKQWLYSPIDVEDSSAVGMDILPNGDLVILERVYKSIFQPVIFALRKLRLSESDSTASVQNLMEFNSTEGWRMDNFEGLARHQGNAYFMVSDDNDSAIQKTLLLYFSIENGRITQ